MITFKQFLHEAPMHGGKYREVLSRVGDTAKMGFEIEVLCREGSEYWHPPKGHDIDTKSLSTLQDIEKKFSIDAMRRKAIDAEYGDFLARAEDEYVDENWNDFDEDEKLGRKLAARSFRNKPPTMDKWIAMLGVEKFIDEFELVPHAELDYMDGWRESATAVAKALAYLVKGVVKVGAKGYTSWNITQDTSIKDYDGKNVDTGMTGYGFEIVSPPLSAKKAMAILPQVLLFCSHNELSTNDTTGIHVNISLPDMEHFDALKLVLFMGDQYVLDKFNRSSNTFTRSQFQQAVDGINTTGSVPSSAEEIIALANDALSQTGKNFSVNLNHVPQYVEFRAAGGGGYEGRAKDIEEVAGRWLTALEIACDPARERNLYLKKVAALRDRAEMK